MHFSAKHLVLFSAVFSLGGFALVRLGPNTIHFGVSELTEQHVLDARRSRIIAEQKAEKAANERIVEEEKARKAAELRAHRDMTIVDKDVVVTGTGTTQVYSVLCDVRNGGFYDPAFVKCIEKMNAARCPVLTDTKHFKSHLNAWFVRFREHGWLYVC